MLSRPQRFDDLNCSYILIFTKLSERLSELSVSFIGPPGPPGRSGKSQPGRQGERGTPGK